MGALPFKVALTATSLAYLHPTHGTFFDIAPHHRPMFRQYGPWIPPYQLAASVG